MTWFDDTPRAHRYLIQETTRFARDELAATRVKTAYRHRRR